MPKIVFCKDSILGNWIFGHPLAVHSWGMLAFEARARASWTFSSVVVMMRESMACVAFQGSIRASISRVGSAGGDGGAIRAGQNSLARRDSAAGNHHEPLVSRTRTRGGGRLVRR